MSFDGPRGELDSMAFTYFFRDDKALELIARHVLPALQGHRYINIWDAGCAHGPEAFSIAITLRENMTHFLFRNVRIFASDHEPSGRFEQIISKAVYPVEEVKRIPDPIRTKYFRNASIPGFFALDDEIRQSVSFIKHDLLSFEPIRYGISLVVCKNVLLHFNEEQRAGVLAMFHASLIDRGFLVMEQTQKLPTQCEAMFERVTCDGQIYRKTAAPQCQVENVNHNGSLFKVDKY